MTVVSALRAPESQTPKLAPLAGRILIVAGEPSSDHHGALVVRELLKLSPTTTVFGMGGSALRNAGADTIVDSEHSASVMGLTEVVSSLGKIRAAYKTLLQACQKKKPDLAILIDYPDFNLLLARALHRLGIPVLYFVSPQLWAWRSGRVKKVKKYVRKMAVIFPFEETFYLKHGVDAEYVGHPLIEWTAARKGSGDFCMRHNLDSNRPIVALLPGSRKGEVSRLLQPMLGAAEKLLSRRPGVQFVVPRAPGLSSEIFSSALAALEPTVARQIRVIEGESRTLLENATIAVVASGTATVEAAFSQVPTIVVYRLSKLTHAIARRIVRGVKHFAMPNLIAGEPVVEELLQDEVSADSIAERLESYLGDPAKLAAARMKLAVVKQKLAAQLSKSAGRRTAEIALELLVESRSRDK